MQPAARCSPLPAILAIVVIVPVAAGAQGSPPSQPPHLRRLGVEDGLAHAAVYAIAEDHQGFLWLGTPAGLDRFDGRETVHLGFGLGTVRAVLVDTLDRFWVGSDAGLHLLDRATLSLTPVPLSSAASPAAVRAIAEDDRGGVWIGAADRLFLADGDSVHEVPYRRSADHDPRAAIVGFSPGPDGGLLAWLAELSPSRSSLLWLNGDSEVEVQQLPLDWGRAGRGLLDRTGRLWLDPWHYGVRTADGWRFQRLEGADPSLLPSCICEGSDGVLWFGTEAGVLLRPDAESPPIAGGPESGRPSWQREQLVTCLVDDRGRVWLGSLNGLFVWDPQRKPFRHLQHDRGDPTSLSGDAVSSLLERRDGRLWIGTYGTGLNLLDRDSGTAQRFRRSATLPTSLCDDRVWSLAAAADGALWVGTETGLCRADGDPPRFSRPTVPGLPEREGDARIKKIAVQSDGTLWLGTNFGLFRLEPRSGHAHHFGTGDGVLASRQVGDLLLEEPVSLWIGSTDGDLQRLELETGTVTSTRLLVDDQPTRTAIYHLQRDDAGDLWAATHLGPARLDEIGGRFVLVTVGDPAPASPIVYSLLPDGENLLWLGTGHGLVRWDPAARRTERFGLADGVGSVELNRHAVVELSDGTIAFGGMGGLTLFHPGAIQRDALPPPVALTGVQVIGEDGERSLPGFGLDRVELTHRDHALTLSFAALALTQAEGVEHAYRLDGLDPDWVRAGAQRVARYTNLAPGRYTFRVKATNRDGVWSEGGVALPIRVRPAFWQSFWFGPLVAVFLAALLIAAYRLRIRRLVLLQQMRLRIASDLHDELGSELSGVALAASVLRRRAQLSDRDQSRLEQVESSARRVMQGLRDIVWTINPEHDTAGALAARMRLDAELLLGDLERQVSISVDDPARRLPMEQRRHLFLAFRELLHNVRHAGHCNVSVRCELRRSGFVLEVNDDGCGFDPATEAPGLGLSSLQRRAEQLSARLELESRPGEGTQVRLARG